MRKDNLNIFKPQLSPKKMLELGVFGGSYFTKKDIKEFPKKWFTKAKLSKTFDVNINLFKIKSGLSRQEWIDKGWIFKKILLVGFNGIVDLQTVDVSQRSTKYKLKDGKLLEIGTFRRLKKIVKKVTYIVEEDRGKRCFNGPITLLFS